MHPGTPYYSYDISLLQRTLAAARSASQRWFSSAAVPVQIHYAVKANHNPVILKLIATAGLGADCVSGGEIREALVAGFKAGDIVYAGVGKTDEEICFALDVGIACFNVESLEELQVIGGIAAARNRTARVALRINPDVGAHTHANITTGLAENKFGINFDKVPEAVEAAQSLPGIELTGIHFHIGSQILDMGDFQSLCTRINAIMEWFVANGVNIRSVNAGGGLGIDYEHPEIHPIPDFDAYFQTFARNLHLGPGQEFHCELGRSIVAQCGSLVSECIYVKQGTDKKFVIVDAGMNDLIRPALYDARHVIENVSASPGSPRDVYDVVGPICESSDCFGKDVSLPVVHRGDTIVIRSAGAYGESMASTFNSRPLPGSEFL